MKKITLKDWVILKTNNYNTIMGKLENAHKYALLTCIIGFPGAGKTTTFRHYTKTHGKDVVYICLDVSFRAKDFYVTLLRELGVPDYGYDVPIKFVASKITETIREREEPVLIIIDDAGRFTAPMMEWFQLIYDSENCGLILSGTKKFKNDFDGWDKQNRLGIPELASRVDEWVVLKEPTKEEMKKVAQKNGVTDPVVLTKLTNECSDYRKLSKKVIGLRIKQVNNAAQTKQVEEEVTTA